MKPFGLCLVFFAALTGAQNSSAPAKPARAAIAGIVTREPGSEPVKKALIELIAENQADGGNYTATSGADGTFQIEGILPGRYRLFAERPGYLEFSKHHARSEGRVLTLTGGQELKDLQIRLAAAAVVRGRVTDEDGEPMPEAQIAVLRQTYFGGHSRWEQVGGERSNDLGEFRVAGLAAGNYFVSVSPPPDFKSLIMGSGGAADSHVTSAEKSSTSYQTIYYPGTPDRSQATAISLHTGDEFPVNFSLAPSPSLSVRGSVVNLPAGSTASIMLQSRDFNLLLNGADVGKDGSFVIRDVSPGNYTIVATVEGARTALMARQALQVVAGDVDGLRLQPQAGGTIRGKLRLESRGTASKLDLSQLFLDLRPSDGDESLGTSAPGTLEGFSGAAHVEPNGNFEWTNVPPGNYYVQIEESPANGDWFLKSVAAGGRDVAESGINVSGGALTVDLLASASGAVVEGVAVDDQGQTMANAVVVAAPEPRLRGHVERYRRAVSDQTGRFTLHGIPPGEYTLFAWESVDGEAYYSPEFLKGYEAQGTVIHVGEGDRKSVKLVTIPESEDQQ